MPKNQTKSSGSLDRMVRLRCPHCKKERKVARDISDPDGCVVVEFMCPDCNPDGFESIEYFNADGGRIVPEWAREPNSDYTNPDSHIQQSKGHERA